jgi:hypothetical protein
MTKKQAKTKADAVFWLVSYVFADVKIRQLFGAPTGTRTLIKMA